ncbi:hypothetical protein, conserved [Trypanosoma brucei gambiense DAL972]|uniref:Uncharacterized protein n=2 Tax=Trypanosoma brucei TaxID=5691 RepID=D0A9S6_TRYB9|nr:hypothetical protein, conserved [Trypanosoma brucei gambiense DAL972]CBH18427.1 hypothetical protein, conserved [Trypanosoma brucei gambiense DAL972]|eukprot:XP_011780691.1 hypothetical protein, conserved [Trypanosoma brucei gambiense DAL972]
MSYLPFLAYFSFPRHFRVRVTRHICMSFIGRRSPMGSLDRAAQTAMAIELGASFDPFDGVGTNEVGQVRLRWWADHVEQELDANRSPFVAAEILLKQMNEYGNSSDELEELLLATILPVLSRCTSYLGTYGDVFNKALNEVIPAIMFTRTLATSHGEVLQRRSYAECFASILCKFQYHVKLSYSLNRRATLEDSVMTRVVRRLDNLWMRMCFRAWRALRNSVATTKRSFQRLANRGAALTVVPGHIRMWRRHAHYVTLKEKLSKHTALNQELDNLYAAEQAAKSSHESIIQEVEEKNRLISLTTERCMEAEARLGELQSLMEETTSSLEGHWKQWKIAINCLFGDGRDSLPPVHGNLRSDLQSIAQNITDTALLFLKEAKKRKWKMEKSTIAQYVNQMGLEKCENQQTGLDDIISTLSRVCKPVMPPLRLLDLIREDQEKYDLTIKFLSCVNGGGHCSLFMNGHTLDDDELSVEGVRDFGVKMVSHVTEGVGSFQVCPDANEDYLKAIQTCLAADELTKVHDYLSRVFFALATGGLPLNREKIERCIDNLVEPHHRQVVHALYPSQGIKNFADLRSYLTRVSNFCLCTITTLVECIENHYDADPKEDLFSVLFEEDVVTFFEEHEKDIHRLFGMFRDKRFPMLLSKSLIKPFLVEKFNLLDSEVDTLFQLGATPEKITRDEFKNFLTVLAAFYTPSPFVPPVKKLASVIMQCSVSSKDEA